MPAWTITDNVLPEVLAEIRAGSVRVLEGAGMLFQEVAVRECPVSSIKEPGYVHLYQTIGYSVDTQTTYFQQWVTFYVLKNYALYVNDGTSRMRPRPFFTRGMLAVGNGIDDVIHRVYFDLMMGRAPRKL